MRVGFRTNIEKELISDLKKKALENGVNANDILEDLLNAYLYVNDDDDDTWNDIEKKQNHILSLTKEKKISYVSSHLSYNMARAFIECGIDLKFEQEKILEYISEAIVKIIFDDLTFMRRAIKAQ